MSDALRAMVARHLTAPCTVLRPTLVSDGAGGNTESLVAIADGYCRIEVITSTADVPDTIKEKVGGRQPYRFTLPHDTLAQPGDRLLAAGVAYDVLTTLRGTNNVGVNGLCVAV